MAWEAGGYIKPGNRQSGEFWWESREAHTSKGQFLEGEIVQNQYVNNLSLEMKGGRGAVRESNKEHKGTGIWCH